MIVWPDWESAFASWLAPAPATRYPTTDPSIGEAGPMPDNVLYYGDNLDVLRRYIKDESVDLVYLDPPFKSNQDYNVLFAEKDGTAAASQFKAFEDTWEWNQASAQAYEEIVESGGKVSKVMQAFRGFL